MKVLDYLQYMVEQEHKALDQLLDRIDNNTLQQKLSLYEQEADTIGKRLVHMISAEYRMATYLMQFEDDLEELKVASTDIKAIREAAQQSKLRHLKSLQHLDSTDLDKTWTSSVSGNSYEYKFLLWHFLEHLATHRGQVTLVVNRILN